MQDFVSALDVQDMDQDAYHGGLQGAFQDDVPEVGRHAVDGLRGGLEVLDDLEGQNGEADLGALGGLKQGDPVNILYGTYNDFNFHFLESLYSFNL